MLRCYVLIFLSIFFGSTVVAQERVKGKVYAGYSDTVLVAASVYNKSKKIGTNSKVNGQYNIEAEEGDTLLFSAVGYEQDTVVVEYHMLLTDHDINMQVKVITLEKVKVSSSYQQDSIDRHNFYANVLRRNPAISRPQNGFGFSFSPSRAFSKEARQKRALKKRLLQQDQDDYIDRSFPKEWVERLTSLHGDSLNLFMYRYRPSYDFCRKTDRPEMILYISDSLKEFRKPK